MNKSLSNQNIVIGLVALLVVYFLFFKKKSAENFVNSANCFDATITRNSRTQCPVNHVQLNNKCCPNGKVCNESVNAQSINKICPNGHTEVNNKCCPNGKICTESVNSQSIDLQTIIDETVTCPNNTTKNDRKCCRSCIPFTQAISYQECNKGNSGRLDNFGGQQQCITKYRCNDGETIVEGNKCCPAGYVYMNNECCKAT